MLPEVWSRGPLGESSSVLPTCLSMPSGIAHVLYLVGEVQRMLVARRVPLDRPLVLVSLKSLGRSGRRNPGWSRPSSAWKVRTLSDTPRQVPPCSPSNSVDQPMTGLLEGVDRGVDPVVGHVGPERHDHLADEGHAPAHGVEEVVQRVLEALRGVPDRSVWPPRRRPPRRCRAWSSARPVCVVAGLVDGERGVVEHREDGAPVGGPAQRPLVFHDCGRGSPVFPQAVVPQIVWQKGRITLCRSLFLPSVIGPNVPGQVVTRLHRGGGTVLPVVGHLAQVVG